MPINTTYIRRANFDLASDSVADGNYDFPVSADGPPNNILEFFHFVDGAGDPVDASAGTVTVTISSGADIFQSIDHGSFAAADARDAARTKPNGFGTGAVLRIALSGVPGAAGFRGLFTQLGN